MRVVAPDGVTWSVRRRWTHRPRWRGRRRLSRKPASSDRARWYDILDVATWDEGCFWPLLGIAALILLFLYGGPILAFLWEVIWAVLALVGGLVARVLFRRPWLIEVESPNERRVYDVVGLRKSGRVMRRVAGSIRTSGHPSEGAVDT